MENKRNIKIVVLGDGAVGKTSLLLSYLTNDFPNEYAPTAFDNYTVSVSVNKVPCTVQFCDTAGQEDFDSLRPFSYPQTDVFVLCFNIMAPSSFLNLKQRWLPEIDKYKPTTPVVLVGTHCDLRSNVEALISLKNNHLNPISKDRAETLAKKSRAVCYVETSALTLKNVKKVFDEAIGAALSPYKRKRSRETKKHWTKCVIM
ncbi:cell division control protein 42 homolog [Dendronephthya gigantea]|uniref:cell division control protein 42 homolog n=1 Tax=Dendronephthya gigantea TaxID=151771 RepID=UPI00106CE7E3|nr:cell division control protein 42 homolog [Dendronephthya gigantea]XP_028398790.1 cell division control protein 42 homolog [Dendronephthya gigantea]